MIINGLKRNLKSIMAVNKITDLDAWADGQIRSKLWLIQLLETYISDEFSNKMPTIWQLAGWYAQLAFFLYIRGNIAINKYRSFDVDHGCEVIAEAINNVWLIDEWKFKAITEDINTLDYNSPWKYHSPSPNIIINTSCEHMESAEWFNRIPKGKLVVLQSTDMKHSTHIAKVKSVDELRKQLPLSEYYYADTLKIEYKNWSFKRFMTIGIK